MNLEFWQVAIPLAVGVLGFLVGGGWPAKTYRAWSDAQLHKRLDDRYVLQVLYDADQRHNNLRHDRSDETMELIRDIQRALTSLTGSVERAQEAAKYANERLQEVEGDVEELKRGRPQ